MSNIEKPVVRHADGAIILELQGTAFELSPKEALDLVNSLGNVAVEMLPDTGALPRITNIAIRPLDQSGLGALALFIGAMPVTFAIGYDQLAALSAAASGALEHAEPAGRA